LADLYNFNRFWWAWKNGTDDQKKEFQTFIDNSETKNFAYQDYAHRFTAQFYEPEKWADIFANSGAQYAILTSKHHEGFCNWDSRNLHHTWNWNAMDIGPRRDLVGELSKAIKNTTSPYTRQKLRFGLYHSLFEWYNPMYREDEATNFTTNHFANYKVRVYYT
jgi:alpha-L-fucosidase